MDTNAPEFEVAIGNMVDVDVKLTLRDAGSVSPKTFKFTLNCERLDQSEIQDRLAACENRMADFMSGVVKGWTGQRLVISKVTGQPAEFGATALEAMLKVAGVAGVCFTAYMTDASAKQKN